MFAVVWVLIVLELLWYPLNCATLLHVVVERYMDLSVLLCHILLFSNLANQNVLVT